ncbi:hypothetical protein [Caulobacter sp. NIBR2454]|uniref:hypothetical protein n=1 Tax=Caulobacter sp. NIBR2454 TaxID=3015996 RepID=UPI0022B62663|nr:hypothetical protein [Caulobacter sp. NIBR2454]
MTDGPADIVRLLDLRPWSGGWWKEMGRYEDPFRIQGLLLIEAGQPVDMLMETVEVLKLNNGGPIAVTFTSPAGEVFGCTLSEHQQTAGPAGWRREIQCAGAWGLMTRTLMPGYPLDEPAVPDAQVEVEPVSAPRLRRRSSRTTVARPGRGRG